MPVALSPRHMQTAALVDRDATVLAIDPHHALGPRQANVGPPRARSIRRPTRPQRQRAVAVIARNRVHLDSLAQLLLAEETIDGDRLRELMDGATLPESVDEARPAVH